MLTDVNECTDGTAKCGENSFCQNTDGSYTCSCNQGFTGVGYIKCDGRFMEFFAVGYFLSMPMTIVYF